MKKTKAHSFTVATLSLMLRSVHLHILNAANQARHQGGRKVFLETWKPLPGTVKVQEGHEENVLLSILQ